MHPSERNLLAQEDRTHACHESSAVEGSNEADGKEGEVQACMSLTPRDSKGGISRAIPHSLSSKKRAQTHVEVGTGHLGVDWTRVSLSQAHSSRSAGWVVLDE